MKKKKSKWISGAIKHPGSFKADAERAGVSTKKFAKEHEHDSGALGRKARLAKTLMKMNPKHKHPSDRQMQRNMYGIKGE